MAIKSGEVANADEVMNAFGKMFKNQVQLIFNADLIGLDSALDEEYENLKRDVLSDVSNIDTTNSDIDDIPIFGANVMDDFEDDSIDTNIWSTSGAVTESSGKLNLSAGESATSFATADQGSTENFNRAGTIFLKIDVVQGGTSGRSSTLHLVDESANSVSIKSYGATTATDTLRFNVEPGSNNVQVYTNDINAAGAGTAVDVSSLTDGDAWHFKIISTGSAGGAGSASIKIYFVRHLSNAIASKDFISSATTLSTTITDAILVVNKTIGGTSSATYYLSADNGSNYESVTLNEVHRFTNTGTQLKIKVTMTNDATDHIYLLNHYAVWYNTEAV